MRRGWLRLRSAGRKLLFISAGVAAGLSLIAVAPFFLEVGGTALLIAASAFLGVGALLVLAQRDTLRVDGTRQFGQEVPPDWIGPDTPAPLALSRRLIAGTISFSFTLLAAVGVIQNLLHGTSGEPPPRHEVTVPITATATLDEDAWKVRQEFRIDEAAAKALQTALNASPEVVNQLREALPIDREWRVDRLVDGTPVYTRDLRVPIDFGRYGIGEAAVPIPRLELAGLADPSVILISRSGSTTTFVGPRAALARTTPPAKQAADVTDGGTHTEVPVQESTREIATTVLGEWWRSPAGLRLYDSLTWAPLPLILGIITLAAVVWSRRKLAALGLRAWNRLWLGSKARSTNETPSSAPKGSGRPGPRIAGSRRPRGDG